jgi:hypothetical protein
MEAGSHDTDNKNLHLTVDLQHYQHQLHAASKTEELQKILK